MAGELGDLQEEIMKRLWRRGTPATARELADELLQDRQIAYNTVMTVLDRLFRKGWLDRELDGRAYRYRPVRSGEAYSAELMRQALDTSPDHAAAFEHFLQGLSAEDARALADAYRRLAGLAPDGTERG